MYHDKGWKYATVWTALAAAATPTAKTPRKARTVAVAKIETGLVNVLVADDNDNTASIGLTSFAKFQDT